VAISGASQRSGSRAKAGGCLPLQLTPRLSGFLLGAECCGALLRGRRFAGDAAGGAFRHGCLVDRRPRFIPGECCVPCLRCGLLALLKSGCLECRHLSLAVPLRGYGAAMVAPRGPWDVIPRSARVEPGASSVAELDREKSRDRRRAWRRQPRYRGSAAIDQSSRCFSKAFIPLTHVRLSGIC